MDFPVNGYTIQRGSTLDRALLSKFMGITYEELFPGNPLTHLGHTVEQYFSSDTPLWWVFDASQTAIGCLWVGIAIDQSSGVRHAHIFLLYVHPEHRRRGIATAMMQCATAWAQARGDQQIGLQVFANNQPAVQLYQSLGYKIEAYSMLKQLEA
ncbi:GNAT family N-acetyltransferase [filamentous cyanobacterium LEGE 11480]|uniref:GNAT family N-acetyltransferase n=1 Tax=Romeriopsis navalis LEGE 11480 TaxID=2777977 RepID=A0A928VQK0_9CYAN|nr:GNAT family N-acetyltransferase [Romeriopsis navalis]MBE9030775.1 GNAT family N-acetyltransferase [Romeriopsis navalis LEGE 11480]